MKLELKYLSAYLPYGLKIKSISTGEIVELSCVTDTSVNIKDRNFQYGMWGDIFNIQPILRPLSDLTKEINYGLSSYAFVDLFEIGDYDGCVFEFEHGNIKTINSINSIAQHSSYHDINYLPHAVVNMMVEYHFDIFGLIDAGLAIDINTLNK